MLNSSRATKNQAENVLSDTSKAQDLADTHDPFLNASAPIPSSLDLLTGETRDTDLGNAYRLVRDFGRDIRYVHAFRSWYIWNGNYWEEDTSNHIHRLAHRVVRSLYEDALAQPDGAQKKAALKFAHKSHNLNPLENMVKLARCIEGVPLWPDELDRDPQLLGVKNGVVDLRTGEFRAGRREDYITKIADVTYDRDATCPNWLSFQERICRNPALIDFKQQLFGITLSGEFIEHLTIMHGSGANGKTTEAETLREILGDYSGIADAQLMMTANNKSAATPEVVALKGKRGIFINETGEHDDLSEQRVKYITSNSGITGRGLYKDAITFQPTHKSFIQTNHKPRIKGTDQGIWRRVFYLPYDVTIKEKDKIDRFRETMLRPEASGILNWLIEGYLKWLNNNRKLVVPQCVMDAAQEYRKEQNTVAHWAELFIKFDEAEGEKISLGELHNCYSEWVRREYGWKPATRNRVSAELAQLGFIKGATNNGCTAFKGVKRILPFLVPFDARVDEASDVQGASVSSNRLTPLQDDEIPF